MNTNVVQIFFHVIHFRWKRLLDCVFMYKVRYCSWYTCSWSAKSSKQQPLMAEADLDPRLGPWCETILTNSRAFVAFKVIIITNSEILLLTDWAAFCIGDILSIPKQFYTLVCRVKEGCHPFFKTRGTEVNKGRGKVTEMHREWKGKLEGSSSLWY